MRSNGFPRPASMLLAAVVGACAVVCTANATTAHLTPDAMQTSYSLNAGANSANITPPAGVPVFVAGVCTTAGDAGAGHVNMLHLGGITWIGINSPSDGTAIDGFSQTAGTPIVKIDFAGSVVMQIASADAFQVHNGTGARTTGSVKMIW